MRAHRITKLTPLIERFWAKVNKDGPIPPRRPELGPCWVWTASVTRDWGYGRIQGTRKRHGVILAHRYSYVVAYGPIPDGLVIDHLCFVPSCVRPEHLDAVPHLTNMRRSDAWSMVISRTGRCSRGHEVNVANVYRRKDRPGAWNCNACRRERRAAGSRN